MDYYLFSHFDNNKNAVIQNKQKQHDIFLLCEIMKFGLLPKDINISLTQRLIIELATERFPKN